MPTTVSTARRAVSENLWEQLTRRIVRDERVPMKEAEEIMEEALVFLLACARTKGGVHIPSPSADIGWHTFILYTREYDAWCTDHAGRFLHHSPLPIEVGQTAEGPICVNNCKCDPAGCCNFPNP